MTVADKVETDAEKVVQLERELRNAEDEIEDERDQRHVAESELERVANERALLAAALEVLSDVERGIFTLAEAKVRIEGLDS